MNNEQHKANMNAILDTVENFLDTCPELDVAEAQISFGKRGDYSSTLCLDLGQTVTIDGEQYAVQVVKRI